MIAMGAGDDGRGSTRQRGLTLIEVMVVIAVLVAIGALALPTLVDAVERRRLDSAVDGVVGQMMMARARAQSDGEMIELVYRPRSGRFEVRELDGDAGENPRGDDGEPTTISESWAVRTVDPAIRVEVGDCDLEPPGDDSPSGDDDGTDMESAGFEDPDGWDDAVAQAAPTFTVDPVTESGFANGEISDEPTRVAVFAGDGSAVVAGCCRLVDERGNAVLIAVSPWTGLPAVDRLDERLDGDESAGAVPRLDDMP